MVRPSTALESVPSASVWGMVRDVFLAPASAFRRLANRHAWLFPYALCALGMLTLNLLTLNRTESVLNTTLDVAHLPDIVRSASRTGYWVGIWMLPWAIPLIGAFAYTALLGFIAPFVHSAQATFGRLYAISLWAMVPAYTLGNLLRALTLMLTPSSDTLTADFSVNAILPESAPMALVVIGKSLDLLAVWTILLLSIGFVSAHKASRKAGLVTVIVMFTIRVAIIATALKRPS